MEPRVLKAHCLLRGEDSEKWGRDPPSVVFPEENACRHRARQKLRNLNFLGPGGTFGRFWDPFWEPKWLEKRTKTEGDFGDDLGTPKKRDVTRNGGGLAESGGAWGGLRRGSQVTNLELWARAKTW